MTDTREARRPQVFDADDPALVSEPATAGSDDAALAGSGAAVADPPLSRPTLATLGERGLRWGAVLAGSLAAAAALGAGAWFARLVSAALLRDDWLGWTTFVLLLIAGFAALMLALRELIGFTRLARLGRLKADVSAALRDRNQRRERKAARRLADLYAARPDLAVAVRGLRQHARDVHDAGELLALADRDVVARLDLEARSLTTRAAKRVATVTALSPMVLIAVAYVLVENLRLMRALATLYGGRPGLLGSLRLGRLVLGHIVATGGIAMTDDLLGQFLGQDILRRLSRRLGEGAFNGALTARIGVAAIEVIRPLPYLAAKPPRVRDILAAVLKPMLASAKA